MSQSVVVVGSANVDVVVPVERHPKPGETLLGGELRRHPGGKGANQAAAAARAGAAPTYFVGGFGDDDAARLLLDSLQGAGVDCSVTERLEGPSGTALIWVTPDGGNTILVAPGANRRWAHDERTRGLISEAGAVLAQLEVPMAHVVEAAKLAQGPFVLNAAPSTDLPDELLAHTDVLVVNEHEAADVAGTDGEPAQLAGLLLERVPAVVLTLGGDGAVVAERGSEPVRIPAFDVTPVDTTGAGDTFCGVLAAELARGTALAEAAVVASAAGALSTTRDGAQDSVPGRDEVLALARDAS